MKKIRIVGLFLCVVLIFALAGCPGEPQLEDLDDWLKNAAFEEVIKSKTAGTLIDRMSDDQKRSIVETLAFYPDFVNSLSDAAKERYYEGLSDVYKEMIFDDLVREKTNVDFILRILELPENAELRKEIKDYFVSELTAEELIGMLDDDSKTAFFNEMAQTKTKEELLELAGSKDTESPDIVTEFKVLTLDRAALLLWKDAESEDVFAYEITFDVDRGGARSLASNIDREALLVQPGVEFAKIEGLVNNESYKFSIRTVDSSGNKSEKCSAFGKIGSDFEKLGTYKVLEDSELASYGISESSVPPRIPGATYVRFGVYPQTVKKDDVKIFESIVNYEISGATYYLGSDGNWYAKCRENGNPDEGNPRYKYSDGTEIKYIADDSTRYFKVEPIIWRKLDADGYLFAEKILASNFSYYNGEDERTLGGKKIYPNNYKYSNMRAWLNGTDNQFVSDGGTRTVYDLDWSGKGFLQQAFTAVQQAKILNTEVNNSGETTGDLNGNKADGSTVDSQGNHYPDFTCENTTDKIFLLSFSEVRNTGNGFATRYDNDSGKGHTTARVPTDYALANYCSIYESESEGGSSWLRSPYYHEGTSIMAVSHDDSVGYTNSRMFTMGITPALKVAQN